MCSCPKAQVRFTLTQCQYVQKHLKLTAAGNRNDPRKVTLSAGVFSHSSLLYRWSVFAPFFFRLFDSSEEQAEHGEDKPECVSPQPVSQSYAATVALSSTPPSSAMLLGTVAHNPKSPNQRQHCQ